jgi:hypothetical protein
MYEYINEVYNVMVRYVNRRDCNRGYIHINSPGKRNMIFNITYWMVILFKSLTSINHLG